MQDYLKRLVVWINEGGQSLSRNRHFHTFATPLGRKALKLSRQLRALARDVVAQAAQGGTLRVEELGEGASLRICLHLDRLKSRRTVYLSPAEWELLLRNEPVRVLVERSRSSAR